jgi:PAS domain S-box-containing protein
MWVGWPQTRLSALHDREVLTTRPEPQFDELSRLAARVCETPFAKISIVDESGSWLTFGVGPDVHERSDECPFCCHAMSNEEAVTIVPDTHGDPRFAGDALVRESPHLRFFAGVPLVMPDGDKVGVFWVADRVPRAWAATQTGLLVTLARQVVTQLALRRANASLAQRESELRSIIETSGEAIYGVDTRGRCTFINPACLRMLGYSEPEDLLGKEMHDVVHYAHANGSPYPKGECTVLAAFREGRAIRLEDEVFWRADGTPIWVIYTSSPLRREGHLVGSVINFVDVTKQRERRQELANAAHVRDRFTSVLGHDLRSPLSTVLMGAQLIANTAGVESARTRTVAVRIAHAAERMQRLVRDLLDFIRVREGGALELSPRRTDLSEIAHEIVGELELANPERRIDLEVMGETSGQWDPDRIAQVCSNLLGNAIHHGATEEPVHMTIRSDAEHAMLVVENGGPPIPDEVRPYLFDPFRRGRTEAHGSQRGLGLGLFIVREIALAHGGDVTFTSDEHRTAFVVRLPRDSRSLR